MNKLKDAIYGFAVADALGVPYEFKPRGSFHCSDMVGHGTWKQPAGTWSDDTSMTLATCASLKEQHKINTKDIMEKFKEWLYLSKFTAHDEVFDIGETTRYAITHDKGLTDITSNGNGSLMRILPLAFIDCTEDEIKEVSSLTHGHELSTTACVIYVTIAKKLLQGYDLRAILLNLKYYGKPFDRLHFIYEHEEIKSSGYVVDTLEAALWCLTTTNSYKDCVLKAVNLGDDTDTTAAVAGGLAGIKYGMKNIPGEWIKTLANKRLIEKCLF
jgi:ADP-ribosyl-[dinitrogen reductase] hydrolase